MHSCWWYLLRLTALQWAENFLLSPYPHTLLPILCLDDPMGLKLVCGSNFFLVGCLSEPVSYKLLYWRCRNRNPYLLVVVVGFFPLWISGQSFVAILPTTQCDLTYWVFFRSFFSAYSVSQMYLVLGKKERKNFDIYSFIFPWGEFQLRYNLV